MAIKTSLVPISKRIAGAVRKAAATHGLAPGEFALTGSFDENAEHISLLLGTDRQVDELPLYKDILQEIRNAFPDDPHFTMHVGLVIRRVKDLEEVYWNLSLIHI